jgi:hypothetical protein
MRGAIRRHQSEEGGNQTSSGPPVSLISPRKEAAIANALAAAAAAAVAGGNAHGNATPAASWRRQRPRQRDPAAVLPSSQSASTFAVGTANAVHGSVHAPNWHRCHRLRGGHCSFPRCHRRCRCRRGRHSRLRQPRGPRIAAAVPTMAPSNCRSGAHDGALELPQRCPRWRQSGPLRPRCGACPSQRPSHRRRASRASWHRRRPHHWRPSLLLRG